MKILHYFLGFPPLHNGGLMIYARDLAKEQLKMGHDVIMLMPGKYRKYSEKSKIKFYKRQDGLPVYQIINSQPVSFSGVIEPYEFIKDISQNNYREFLAKNKIDVLHVHSLSGLPKEFIYEAKKLKVKVVFTTHDYFGLCPKINLFNYNNSICLDYRAGEECVKCNYDSTPRKYVARNLFLSYPLVYKLVKGVYNHIRNYSGKITSNTKDTLKKVENNNNLYRSKGYAKFRSYYIDILEQMDLIIFNSFVAKQTFSQYISTERLHTVVVPVTHSQIKDNRKKFEYVPLKDGKVNFVYLGYLNRMKGFFDLMDALEETKERYKNWQLHIYGDYTQLDLKKYDNKFYKFYGRYSYDNLPEIFSNASLIIIPSKWKETFGFIGLEAYSYGIPALVSENVGFSMLIKNNKNGIIYKESKDNLYLKQSIAAILEQPEILQRLNQSIIEDYEFDNHLIENHAKKIIELYINVLP